MIVRLVLGLLITVVGLALAGRRVLWLAQLIRSGQPASGRTDRLGARAAAQLREVFGQRKLLKWSVPGLAHFFTFWGFLILFFTIVEAWGALFDENFAFWWIGRQPWLGFLEDFFTVAVLVALATFAVIRVKNAPERKERASRFYGSHTGPAWLVLAMIAGVMVTLLLYRAGQYNTGHFPFDHSGWPFATWVVAQALAPLGVGVNAVIETVFLLGNIAVITGFLVLVVHSKHLHIALAPLNVTAKRLPDALGPLLPVESGGKPVDFTDPGDDDIFGRGKIEDFTWKGMLDFATCTECGRCQSQCPAWNTGKPLSPKMVIMDLRDHLFDRAPYVMGQQEGEPVPLVAEGGVIEPDVLWSCTTCGACVEQCPVDIEHVDHIVDMRRYQVMIESEFPTELGALFRGLENKGNPWGQNNNARMDWAKDLGFEVPVITGELPDDTEWLFWVGCAGSFDDKARVTVQATAELLHIAGVKYGVLGNRERCTGDPARRSGNEFLFQMLAQETAGLLNETFGEREPGRRKIVTTCPHCMNTLGREYPQLEGNYEVVHHTQLLNRLVREKKLTPIQPAGGSAQQITYHDPCYLGRHNKVYEPPRELAAAAGTALTEMPRHADRSLCCGAGGARMWMEERIGKRINLERVDEALATGAETIATACPFCRVMVTDGLVQRQSEDLGAGVNVRDVSQLLLEAVHRSRDTIS